MFLSLYALGADANFNSAIPPKIQFSDILIRGECTVDDLHLKNIIISNDDIIAGDFSDWDFNTVLIARFDGSLEAGNLTNSDMPITSWRIYRKKKDDLIYKLLVELPFDPTVASFTDTTVRNKIEYDYEVRPVSEGTEGNGIKGVGIVDFYGWILSSVDGTKSFTFDMELSTESIQTVTDVKEIENYTQFPVVSKGKLKYKKGSITCMPYEVINNNYEITLNILEVLDEFINNSDAKILKNSKGEMFKVATSNFSHKYLDKISSQPYNITFSWTQIANMEG